MRTLGCQSIPGPNNTFFRDFFKKWLVCNVDLKLMHGFMNALRDSSVIYTYK